VERLDTIPGVSRFVAVLIVAEVGTDLSRFPSDRHLTAWAGLAPGNNETGGKQRPAAARKGNRYLRRGLVQAAHGAARTRDSYFRALYHRIAARRGKQRAAVAVARSILQIAYHLIRRKEVYRELGADYFDRLDRNRTTTRLVRRLERLGYSVRLTELSPGTPPDAVAPPEALALARAPAFS
jgi:transposase